MIFSTLSERNRSVETAEDSCQLLPAGKKKHSPMLLLFLKFCQLVLFQTTFWNFV